VSHNVGLTKLDIRIKCVEWSNIENFDFPKTCHVSYESVNAGPDVDMPARRLMKNMTGSPDILMEVAAAGSTRSGVPICQARVNCSARKVKPRDGWLIAKPPRVSNKSGKTSQSEKGLTRVNPKGVQPPV